LIDEFQKHFFGHSWTMLLLDSRKGGSLVVRQ
jgi:hypothetical protein